MPNIAKTDGEIISCFETMAELRPHLIKDGFLSTVRALEKSGYNLLYIEEESIVVAVAGYLIAFNLFMGKHLYIDDLVTAESVRSKGYGEVLVSWLRNLAQNEGCSYLHLDSETHRGRAHKFYFEQGFTITSYHFSEHLESQ
jgi:GNAT superfamily N-acetyltransferase